jgi:hypothetical protein
MDANDGLHAVLPEELGDLLLRGVIGEIADVKRPILARLRTTTAAAPPPPAPGSPRRGGSDEKGRTDMERPACREQSRELRAAAASSDEENVTNPKPRGRPVARSRGRLTSTTFPPVASKISRSASSVMESGRPATKSLRASSVAICCLVRQIPGANGSHPAQRT